jgi:hypothetical protein
MQVPQPQGQQLGSAPGQIDLFAPAPHPPQSISENGAPNMDPTERPNAVREIAKVLDGAASSPYATRLVQELAAFAKTLV